MPSYQPNIPTGTVRLDVDYQNLQGNFEQANIVYGTDHYPFDNATANQGFHNVVTTPPYVEDPPTGLPPVTAANPKAYAFEQYAALGVLHYSRGPTNAVPTPLTSLHSTAAGTALGAGATLNVLDFTGISLAFATLYAQNAASLGTNRLYALVLWSGSGFYLQNLATTGANSLAIQATGNILQIKNNGGALADLYWTLEFARIQ